MLSRPMFDRLGAVGARGRGKIQATDVAGWGDSMEEMNDDIIEVYGEDETAPEENVIAAETAGMPLLFPSQVASRFPKDRVVAVHSRNVYMGCSSSNRWVKDGYLDKPVGAQSIFRQEVGRFCDSIFSEFPPPPKEAKKDYRNVLF